MYRKNNVEPKMIPCKTVEEFFSRIQQPMDWVYNQVNSLTLPQCVRIFDKDGNPPKNLSD